MNFSDFCAACELLAKDGIQVDKAEYDGLAFGSWFVEVSFNGRPRRRISWDGRDRWLILQSQDADQTWKDEWVSREPHEQTVAQVMSRLLGYTAL